MRTTKYLFVGGGMASLEAAKQVRKLDPGGPVLLLTEEPHLPYNRPPLSKHYLRGEMPREKVFFQPPSFYAEQRIETLLGARAEGLEPAKATVTLWTGEQVRYDKLLIATGGSPIKLPVPGADQAGIHYLRTMGDSEAIGKEAGAGKKAVLVGAGFIGLEVAASLAMKGVQVTVLEALPRIWPRFAGEGLASFVQRYCEERGVAFHTNDAVAEFAGGERVASVKTTAGKEYSCDFVCVGAGIRPRIELAQAGGLALDNGIVVDERMHTSHPNIYAAGDVVNYPDNVFGKRRRVEHWGHAEYTGQVAGMNMAGKETSYDFLTYVWSDIFDLHLEFAGDEEEHDQTIVRGRMEDKSFTVLYLKGGLLQAYFAVNTPSKEFPIFQRLIRRRKDVSANVPQLQDPGFNVRGLL